MKQNLTNFVYKATAKKTVAMCVLRDNIRKALKDESGFSLVELAGILAVMFFFIYSVVKPNLGEGFAIWGQNVIAWLKDSAH